MRGLTAAAFGMNVHAPHNGDAETHKNADGSRGRFTWFAGICVFMFIVTCGLVFTIRYWRWAARKKFGRKRGEALPSNWDGFWGLQ